MKNLLTLILGLIIGALIMYFYCCKDNVEESGPITVTPRGIITPTEAQTLNNNWTELRKAVNDSVAENEIDNRSAWYSIKDVRNYLDLIQKDNDKVTGIRLYLGVNKNLDAGGKTTIFMVPTTPNPNSDSTSKRAGDPNIDDPNGSGLDRGVNGMPPGQPYPN